jgi:hypothetical protein
LNFNLVANLFAQNRKMQFLSFNHHDPSGSRIIFVNEPIGTHLKTPFLNLSRLFLRLALSFPPFEQTMGNKISPTEEAKQSQAIQRDLNNHHTREMRVQKLLLLGSGDSGAF